MRSSGVSCRDRMPAWQGSRRSALSNTIICSTFERMIVLGRAKVKAGTGHFDGAVRRGGAGKRAANQAVNQTGAAAQIAAACRSGCTGAPRWRRNASSVV
ncbi:hypothetical protein BVIET440_110085 [Burkholderia vietnamiensis]